MILTDALGRPLLKPQREDFGCDLAFVEARHAYYDEVHRIAMDGFNRAWRAVSRNRPQK